MIRVGVIVDNQEEEGEARALSEPAVLGCGRQPVPQPLGPTNINLKYVYPRRFYCLENATL